MALKEWSGVSSTEEFLVKNAVSAFLETPLYRPRDVRAAEIVAASWGYDSEVKATHYELIGMGADLICLAITEEPTSPASGPCLAALVNLSRLLHIGNVALVSRSDGDWGDLTAHGNGPTGHELLVALLYGVRKERVGSATVLVVSTTRGGESHRDGTRLTTGVFDKHSVTAGDVQRVVKDIRLVELGPHRGGVAVLSYGGKSCEG